MYCCIHNQFFWKCTRKKPSESNQQLDEIVIAEDTVKKKLTVYVADKIDRKEETMTGIDS